MHVRAVHPGQQKGGSISPLASVLHWSRVTSRGLAPSHYQAAPAWVPRILPLTGREPRRHTENAFSLLCRPSSFTVSSWDWFSTLSALWLQGMKINLNAVKEAFCSVPCVNSWLTRTCNFNVTSSRLPKQLTKARQLHDSYHYHWPPHHSVATTSTQCSISCSMYISSQSITGKSVSECDASTGPGLSPAMGWVTYLHHPQGLLSKSTSLLISLCP